MGLITDNSSTRYKLEEEVTRLEQSAVGGVVKPSLPQVTLTEREYDAPSDELLETQAKDGLAQYRKDGIAAIKTESANNAERLQSERATYETDRDGDIRAVNATYKTAAQNIDNDVLRRGLARSSIAVNAKSELEGGYAAATAAVQSEYGKKIAELDAEINSVGSKLASALNDFNLSYATKLNETLQKLKSERDAEVKSVLEYNNAIREKQAKLDADRAKTESDLYDAALDRRGKETSLDGLSTDKRNALYESVYAKMDEYLSQMSATDAKQEIRNHTFYRDHLGDFYYYKLYDKYGR